MNHHLFPGKPADEQLSTFEAFLEDFGETHPALQSLAGPDGEAVQALEQILSGVDGAMSRRRLPFPVLFNADRSLAVLCYALARLLRPEVVVETGVGYGITSAVTLLALERNAKGRLISIDLAPLSDPAGAFVGLAVPDALRTRWTLHRGDSRSWLGRVVEEAEEAGLFISDSANVYTLQRFEFTAMWPRVSPGGAAIFNNISSRFWEFIKQQPGLPAYAIRQQEKTRCATGLILKPPAPVAA